MLAKMLIHGLVGAAVIGAAAAVFAQSNDDGTLAPGALPAAVADQITATVTGGEGVTGRNTGYLTDRERGREHGKKSEHHREGRHHDDDDD